MTATVRSAGPQDVPELLRLVHALAEYEREPDAVQATEQMYADVLFPTQGHPTAFAEVAEVDGEVVGMAIWFLSFSTWTGTNGVWLEDLFVEPAHRGSGLGVALLRRLASICVERGYRRFEWWVLDWNSPSIDFYRAAGARAMDEWTTYRMDGAALHSFASGS